MTDEDIRTLSEALASNTIQYMDLRGNRFGDDGAISLAQGLRNTPNLSLLNISDNHIGSLGARSLLLCAEAKALRLILLCNNAIQRDIVPLMHTVAQWSHILWIDARGNRIHSSILERYLSHFQRRLSGYSAPIGPIHDTIQQLKRTFNRSDEEICIASDIRRRKRSQKTCNLNPETMAPKQFIRHQKLSPVGSTPHTRNPKEYESVKSYIQRHSSANKCQTQLLGIAFAPSAHNNRHMS